MSLPALNLDHDFSLNPFSLPSFPDTYSTPSRNARRVSARNSRLFESSSPALTPGEDGASSPGGGEDERISSLDPRRLTPTLHATLVSEILNLRHEVQSKSKDMLGLEESLSSTRDENARLNKLLAEHTRETRTLKHHMKELEGGTMSALDDMAAERDRAVEQATDLKKRFDTLQSKTKQQSDDADRTNTLWEKDQEKWNAERRALHHKVTIAESRLKTVLKEFEAVQAMHQGKRSAELLDRSQSRASRLSGRRSVASVRRDSSASSDGDRRKHFSHISEIEMPANQGTLADELALDDGDDAEEDMSEPYSLAALPEEQRVRARPFSAQSHRQSAKAFKLLGLMGDGATEHGDSGAHAHDFDDARRYGLASISGADSDSQSQYSDNATQYSRPSTPKPMGTHTLDTITEASSLYTIEDYNRDHRLSDLVPPVPAIPALLQSAPVMVSSAVQTMEPFPVALQETPAQTTHVPGKSVAVQTTDTAFRDREMTASPALGVPLIAIHRPNSSRSDRSVVLPPHTKSVSCQAAISVPLRSVSMQTEEIRIDQRPIKLPAHLLPSAISSKPSSPAPERQRTKVSEEPRYRVPSPVLKRVSREPKRQSAEQISNIDGYVSDDSFILREPMKKTLSRVRDSWQVVPVTSDKEAPSRSSGAAASGSSISAKAETQKKAASGSKAKQSKASKALQVNTAKADSMRRTALVASGSAAQVQRSRSPSLPTLPTSQAKSVDPPFPVPDRSSSRKFPWEGSDGTASPTLQTVSFFGGDQEGRRQRRPPVKKAGLRKSRSEISQPVKTVRSRSRSPPPTSASSFTELESPSIKAPPLPNDDINSPFRIQQKVHRRDVSATHSAAGSAATTESIHVVDAIAQTMIGEWMWKYTRRRKSFGLGGGGADEFDSRGRDGDALRHQRWVWLAPCERAVLWSSKQPVSSVALQGRAGHRKLEIQSVLDVRDDAPMPRGVDLSSCFGRSILIITPQRALKFTAMTRERHYLWLSALSFLSQPGAVPAELGGVPPVPSLAEFTAPPPPSRGQIERNRHRSSQHAQPGLAPPVEAPKPVTAFLRRHPVRDSIRIAKGKARPTFTLGGRRAYTDPPHAMPPLPGQLPAAAVAEQPEESDRGAEPPLVPRTAAHTRKRSNTGPRAASSFRSMGSSNNGRAATSNANSKTASFTTVASSNSAKNIPFIRTGNVMRWPTGIESEPSSAVAADMPSVGYSSRFNSIARHGSGLPGDISEPSVYEDAVASPAAPGFSAEQVGTVRMDAFVRDTLGAPGPPRAGRGPGLAADTSAAAAASGWREPWSAGAVEGRTGHRRIDLGLMDPFAGF